MALLSEAQDLFDEQEPDIATTQPVSGPTSSAPDGGDTYEPPPPGPVTPPQDVDENGDPITIFDGGDTGTDTPPATTDPVQPVDFGDTTVQDLYPDMPDTTDLVAPDVPDATGADVTVADSGVTEQDTTQAADGTGGAIDAGIDALGDVSSGEQTTLTAEQQVDAELARILGEDSPLLAQARAEAMRLANKRGLMNSSMAAGMGMDAMTKVALPMAQQNAQQAFQREIENTRNRQEAGLFTAEQETRLRALEAELGQELSIFNADQLNQAEMLAAELRTAIEQGNAEAYNDASLQLAELQREAEAQQAELDYAADEREALERQAYNERVIEAVSRLNERYMIGEQQIDIQNIIGQYGQLTATNESAARIMDSYLRSIGNIFDDPDMSTAQANEAINNMVSMMQNSLRMIAEMNNMDFEVDLGGSGGGYTDPIPGGDIMDGGGGGAGGGGANDISEGSYDATGMPDPGAENTGTDNSEGAPPPPEGQNVI